MELLTGVGLVVTVVSLVYAVYQGRERRKLADFTRGQVWHLYSHANRTILHLQGAQERYKSLGAEHADRDLTEFISMADAYGQDLIRETVRQIQLSEPSFTMKDIEGWVSQGKIGADHRKMFEKLCA